MTLKNIARILPGYPLRGKVSNDPEGQMGIIQMKDISRNGINWDMRYRMNPTGKKAPRFLQQWDIIFSGRGTKVFATTVDVQPVKTVASPQFFVIRPQDPRNARYITWYINAYSGQRYLWRNAGGSAILNVKKEVLENLPLPLPSEKDLPAVTDYINAMETEKKFHAALQQERQRMLEGIISKSMEA